MKFHSNFISQKNDNFTQKIRPTESIIFVSVHLVYLNYFGIIGLSTSDFSEPFYPLPRGL